MTTIPTDSSEIRIIHLRDGRSLGYAEYGAPEGKLLLGEPWGFTPEDISMENVHLWHGELDANVPVSMGRAMADRIPHCQAKFYPHEAHLSLLLNNADEILMDLCQEQTG